MFGILIVWIDWLAVFIVSTIIMQWIEPKITYGIKMKMHFVLLFVPKYSLYWIDIHIHCSLLFQKILNAISYSVKNIGKY